MSNARKTKRRTAPGLNRILASEFRCPKCGSARWGTSGCTGPFSKMRGHCHTMGCGFSWPRSEDWKHFIFTIRPTRAEYGKLEALRLREANRGHRRAAVQETA